MQSDFVNLELDDNSLCSVTFTGKQFSVTWSETRSTGGSIKKLNSDLYMDSEGEVHEFNHIENRAGDLDNVRKTMKVARDIINTNCTHPDRLRWLTLTYAANMTDSDRLYLDVKHFIAKLRKSYGSCEYITAVEPQGRGAWHCHIILIFPAVAPFLPNKTIADLWGFGFVNIQKVANVDNIGAYLSAYMADIEYYEHECPSGCIVERYVDGIPKKFVKGGRLSMYPPGMHIFRYSKGIKRPQTKVLSYKQVKSIAAAQGKVVSYQSCSCLVGENFVNYIMKESYK